jgi:ribosomal protein L20A (L18A)
MNLNYSPDTLFGIQRSPTAVLPPSSDLRVIKGMMQVAEAAFKARAMELERNVREVPGGARREPTEVVPKPEGIAEVATIEVEGSVAIAARAAQKTIEKIQEELSRNKRARAIDVVYQELTSRLLATRFEEAAILIQVLAQQKKLPLAILLSALTASRPWRATLGKARAELSKKARELAADESEEKVRQISRFL